MPDTTDILARLRRFGVRLALDDFGTGFSSLSYLLKFRFDKIKIDRSFVSRLGRDDNASAIIRTVVGLTETLKICSNVEGVETPDQAALLLEQGCVEVQGYFYGRPMSAETFARRLDSAVASNGIPHELSA